LGSKTDVPENGESAEAAIAQPQDETAENAGGETEAVPTNEPQSDDETEISSDSPYQYIYPDMMVDTPAATVREQGTVYLTFDDGPSSNTEAILNYLREYNIKATFFVVPNRSEECYERLRAIVNDGHSIGVHSASHDYEKIYASVEAYLDDFYEAWDIIYEATGVKTEIFRFPGGSKNDFNEATRDEIIEEMTRRGFRFYDWNVDSNDAGGANWSDMYNSVPEDISGNYRSIVLMHDSDTRTNTVLVLEDILNVLVGEGYKLDKISNDTRPVQFIGPYA
jgi:peptidoglycan/xylan/chitin deacetylase (PgdA/CDA1 family)